jgi:hypothetical protein
MLAHVVCLRHRRRISNLRHYRRNNGMAYPIPFRHNSPHRNVTKAAGMAETRRLSY